MSGALQALLPELGWANWARNWGRRCALFHTNSMGAVHLTSVPDMIVQCLDCSHRFTI